MEAVRTSETSVYFNETTRPPASIIRAVMETLRISETSVYFNEATRRYIPE
jgi:hypothetical protein